jgi:hypothetical protein
MDNQQQSPMEQSQQSPAPQLTPISDKAATLLDESGKEVWVNPDAPSPVEETDLIELPDIDGDEEETPEEETPPEEDDKPLTLDEKFTNYFVEQTGMEVKEFTEIAKAIQDVFKEVGGADNLREGLAELKNVRIAQQIVAKQDELATLWGVDIKETQSRLAEIKPYFNKMSKADKALYDNPKGADVLWRSLQAGSAKTKSTKSSPNTGGKRYLFTQSQIDAMSAGEYRANADKITHAYTHGLVG